MCNSRIQLTPVPADTAWCQPGNTITLRFKNRPYVALPREQLTDDLKPFVIDEELPPDHWHLLNFADGRRTRGRSEETATKIEKDEPLL